LKRFWKELKRKNEKFCKKKSSTALSASSSCFCFCSFCSCFGPASLRAQSTMEQLTGVIHV
jgi:hypothetical protein